MITPGITAPVASFTIPAICAVFVCASMAVRSNKDYKTTHRLCFHSLSILRGTFRPRYPRTCPRRHWNPPLGHSSVKSDH
jgi:hypothetical protein